MKKNLLIVLFLISIVSRSNSQTAVNFTCNDCNNTSHDLFAECDAGNVVVICWVMPCSACVSGALTCSNICQSYPSHVSFYLCDDYANTNCTSLGSWASSNNITYAALFSNAAIRMADYGTGGMPKAVVIGGSNHTVFYNANNTFSTTLLQDAINQALTVAGINEQELNVSSFGVFPSLIKGSSVIKFNLTKSSEISISIFNLTGKKLDNIYSGKSTAGENNIPINLESYADGMYLIKLTEGDKSQYANVVVLH